MKITELLVESLFNSLVYSQSENKNRKKHSQVRGCVYVFNLDRTQTHIDSPTFSRNSCAKYFDHWMFTFSSLSKIPFECENKTKSSEKSDN